MRRYEVTTQCYVPVGSGRKFKKPGQVVTLDDDDAAELADFLIPLDEGVAKRNTKKPKKVEAEPETQAEIVAKFERAAEEVSVDAGEPTPAVQRAGAEVDE